MRGRNRNLTSARKLTWRGLQLRSESLKTQKTQEDILQRAFQYFDRDGNGKLDKNEFMEVRPSPRLSVFRPSRVRSGARGLGAARRLGKAGVAFPSATIVALGVISGAAPWPAPLG